MTTPRQVEANRLNARKSTGPRTAAGKDRSRMNAVTHGLSARTLILPDEDPRNTSAGWKSGRSRSGLARITSTAWSPGPRAFPGGSIALIGSRPR